MAITALATSNTTIGPAEYADMTQALAPRFRVDSPTDMLPSYSSGTLSLQTGAATAAGTRIRLTGTNSVAIPTPSSGSIFYSVVVRIVWANPAASAATLTVVSGTTVNQTSTYNAAQINRIPGVVYDALVCIVRRTAGSSIATVYDMRVWGGDGGPLRVTQAGIDSAGLLDMRPGSMISTDRGVLTKRLDDNGTWADVGTVSNPWKLWTPTMRYYGNSLPDGSSGGTAVVLGSGGTYSGRYRVVDGMLDGYVQVIPGTGSAFGTGHLTLDIPLPCADWQEDTWSMGHIYTDKSTGAAQPYDWHAEVLIKRGWTRGVIWTSPHAGAADLQPHSAALGTNAPGKGVPYIANSFSTGAVYTFHLNYPVA